MLFVLQVLETSHKLLQLQKLLGEQDDVDVVWMLIREPGYAQCLPNDSHTNDHL